MSDPYNGHDSYEHWDVSSTIANDEYLYNLAEEFAKQFGASRETAQRYIEAAGEVKGYGGSRFTEERVMAALEEYEDE